MTIDAYGSSAYATLPGSRNLIPAGQGQRGYDLGPGNGTGYRAETIWRAARVIFLDQP